MLARDGVNLRLGRGETFRAIDKKALGRAILQALGDIDIGLRVRPQALYIDKWIIAERGQYRCEAVQGHKVLIRGASRDALAIAYERPSGGRYIGVVRGAWKE